MSGAAVKWFTCAGVTAALVSYWGQTSNVLCVIIYITAATCGAIVGVYSALDSDDKHRTTRRELIKNRKVVELFEEKLRESRTPPENGGAIAGSVGGPVFQGMPSVGGRHRQMVFSRNADIKLQEIIDLALRDFVTPWYSYLVPEYHQHFTMLLRDELWLVMAKIKERYLKMDEVQLISSDLVGTVNRHLRRLRLSMTARQPLSLHHFLASPEEELEHLRTVCDFLLTVLLPSSYALCVPLRLLLKEIFTCQVLYPAIDMLCSPDYINLKLVSYLKWLQEEKERHKRTYAMTETFEDFVFVIQTCADVEDLKVLRYKIMAEIMHATTLNNIKKQKGLSADKEIEPPTLSKGDLLLSRNLPKYIRQLQFAKGLCEKKLKSLGGPDYLGGSDQDATVPGRQVLAFRVIMNSELAREHLRHFFEKEMKEEGRNLLGFWCDVDQMMKTSKDEWHQLGNEIYITYIKKPHAGIRLSKQILKDIEAFIMANKGPEGFIEAQRECYRLLEDKHYHSFLLSESYHQLIVESKKVDISTFGKERSVGNGDTISAENESSFNQAISLADSCQLARAKLSQLKSRLNDKLKALSALRASFNSDPKMIAALEKETSELKIECSILSKYMERTDRWSDNIGRWVASVEGAQVDRDTPRFTVIVSVSQQPDSGYVVNKSISDFHQLLQNVLPISSTLKRRVNLPSIPSKMRLKAFDQAYLSRAKASLQTFLDVLLRDELLQNCEAVCSFFNEIPSSLLQPIKAQGDESVLKKTLNFLPSLFKGDKAGNETSSSLDDEDDLFLELCDSDLNADKMRVDSIAEPLYHLLAEMFELQGGNPVNWLRRTLIMFVQISFGKTINRLRD
ncbi:sorting nexin-25-like isoform X2 [Varroa destructor]|uniref:Sorting nexin-25 n=1 Tax=Varroa destructor TaxID=109461 RepID=A0A7M7J0T9_VARDE|nr:sorting nexin-25-like isoform X2 [Varroa destructor]